MPNEELSDKLNLIYSENGSERNITLEGLRELDPSKNYRLSIRKNRGELSMIHINKSVEQIVKILNEMNGEKDLSKFSVYIIDRRD